MNAPTHHGVDYYLGEFARLAPTLPGHDLPWLRQAREAAMERFARLGFPGLRDEDWKYTSVAAIERQHFAVAPALPSSLAAGQAEGFVLPGTHLLVFVDGGFEPRLSRLGALPDGVTVGSLAEALRREPGELEGRLGGVQENGTVFAALNQAFACDGAYIQVLPGRKIQAPIQLLFLASRADLLIQPRNLILAEEGSSVCIIEQHGAVGEGTYFTNAVTGIVVGQGATVEHHKLQQEGGQAFHIASITAEQGRDSRLVSTSFALGATLARVDIAVGLAGEGAACNLDGLYIAGGRQHLDHHTRIDHLKPRCSSREIYKGVLAGASRAVFNGKVIVHPDAQQSDAFQSNHNLLLSENAEVDTKPQLEIFADDVKCGHGATVGQLDPEQLFYLRSRGVDEGLARTLLTAAFAREVVDRVGFGALQERLDQLLSACLSKESS